MGFNVQKSTVTSSDNLKHPSEYSHKVTEEDGNTISHGKRDLYKEIWPEG